MVTNLFNNVAKMNATLAEGTKRRKSFIDSVLKGDADDEQFTTLLLAKQAREDPTPVASALSAPAGPAPGGPGTAHHVGDGHNHATDALGKKGQVDPNFQSALNQLLARFPGKVSIGNSYRSPERQAQLWQAALKKYGSAEKARKWVAPPGKSNHGRGLAADLKYNGIDPKIVHAAAAELGLHFPLAHENWHVEPISTRKKR